MKIFIVMSVGIKRLLADEVYESAYPLHEVLCVINNQAVFQ